MENIIFAAFIPVVIAGLIALYNWTKPNNEKDAMIKFYRDDVKLYNQRLNRADIVFRQVWSENERIGRTVYGECWHPDSTESVRISKEDAFSLNLVHEDWNECAAIFFIRKGVKAHYDELRQQSRETTDHLKHTEQ